MRIKGHFRVSVLLIFSAKIAFSQDRMRIDTKSFELKNAEYEKIIEDYGGVFRTDQSFDGVVHGNNKFRFEQEGYLDYRFKGWLDGVKEYLVSSKAIEIGTKIRSDYWSNFSPVLRQKYADEFILQIGYNQHLEPDMSVVKRETQAKNYRYKIEKIVFLNRFGFENIAFVGTPKKKPRGIMIVLHGRYSGPDNLLGIADQDYNRNIGQNWLEMGYLVYAPLIHPVQGPNPNILGLSSLGLDVSNVLDIVKFARENSGKMSIAVHGLSYGAEVAEDLGIISNEISCVISSGGSARGDLILRAKNQIELVGKEKSEHFAPLRSLLYDGASKYKLVFPKALVVSIGIKDHHNSKLQLVPEISEFYTQYGKRELLGINMHNGGHINDFDGEYSKFLEVCSN